MSVSFRDSFVNLDDHHVFDPTNRININNHLLLPINRALGAGGEDFWPFALLPVQLALLLTLSL